MGLNFKASFTLFRLKLFICLLSMICGVFFSGFSVDAAETVLQYSLTQTRTPFVSANATPKKEKAKEKEIKLTSKKKVVLGKAFFSVKEGPLERIYDFKMREIHYLDHQAKSHVKISLFADPAFRLHEFQHRLNMSEAVKKAGGSVPEDLFTLESIFGMEAGATVVLTEDSSEKNKSKFSAAEKNVAEMTWDEKKPIAANDLFAKFLIYDNAFHPVLIKKIIQRGYVPQVVRSHLQNPDSEDQSVLILDDSKTQEDRGFRIPGNYALSKKRPGAAAGAMDLDRLLQFSTSKKNQIKRHDKTWFEARWLQAKSEKKYLEAALTVLEYGFQTGDQKTTAAVMQTIAEHQKDDVELDRFLRSLGVSGQEQAERAITELRKIDRKKLSRAHVIDIFIANQMTVLGQNLGAQKLMMAALKVNPSIAGAYKDLGDMFFAEFDMASAWRCWDFGRKQVPDHFMLKPISDYEAELLKNLPDFF